MNCRFNVWTENGVTKILFESTDNEKITFVGSACQSAYIEDIPDQWRKAFQAEKELRRLLESGNCNDCAICDACRFCPKWGEPIRANCPHFIRKGDRRV